MHLRVTFVFLAISLSGCYAEGNSHFLSTGQSEVFLTVSRCEREAQSKYQDGSPKYSGYECRYKFLIFTLRKKDYQSGKLSGKTE